MPGTIRPHSTSYSRKYIISALLLVNCPCLPAQTHTRIDPQAPIRIDLEAMPLRDALKQVAQAAKISIPFDAPIPAEVMAPPLHADLTPNDAIARVLSGKRLHAVWVDERRALIVHEPEPNQAQGIVLDGAGKTQANRSDDAHGRSVESGAKNEDLQNIIVSTSYLDNVDTLTPVNTLGLNDLTTGGYANLAQLFEQMPQNLAGVSRYSNPIVGNSPGAVYNQTFGSAVELNAGGGAGSTLVLLNGSRLPSALVAQWVDISAFPWGAIDRVKIQTEGASALYGSDALGGVVDIQTLESFKGAEVTVRSNGISANKAPDYAASVLAGGDWSSSGGVFATVSYEKDHPLYADARSFTATASGPTNLVPEQQITNTYARARERWSEKLSQTLEVFASDRRYRAYDSLYGYSTALDGRAVQVDATLQTTYQFPPAGSIGLTVQLPIEKDVARTAYPSVDGVNVDHYTNQAPSVELHLVWPPFTISDRDVRIVSGATFRNERFELASSYAPNVTAHRQVRSVFGGIRVQLLQDLAVDLAARYDNYSDFGDTANPKLSLLWNTSDQVSVHISYGTAFKAPTLYSLHAPQFAQIVQVTTPASTRGSLNTLLIDGGNVSLTPEHARSVDVGFTYRPESVPGLRIEVSEVDTQYKDRIDQLSQEGFTAAVAIQEAASLGSLVTLSPTMSQIEHILRTPGLSLLPTPVDVNEVDAVAYVGYANVGSSSLRALQANIGYHPDADGFTAGMWSSYRHTYVNRLTPRSSGNSLMERGYSPPAFRTKADVGWVQGKWSVGGRVNYTSSYHSAGEPAGAAAPGCNVSDWMTVDVNLAYSTQPGSQTGHGGTRIALGIMNLFDSNPPFFCGRSGLSFDPANSNPMGRMVQFTFTQQLAGL